MDFNIDFDIDNYLAQRRERFPLTNPHLARFGARALPCEESLLIFSTNAHSRKGKRRLCSQGTRALAMASYVSTGKATVEAHN